MRVRGAERAALGVPKGSSSPGSGGCLVPARRGEGRSLSELWILKISFQSPPIRPSAKNRPPTLRKGDAHVLVLCRGIAWAPPPRSWEPTSLGWRVGRDQSGEVARGSGVEVGVETAGEGSGRAVGGGPGLCDSAPNGWPLPLHVRLTCLLSLTSEMALPAPLVPEG